MAFSGENRGWYSGLDSTGTAMDAGDFDFTNTEDGLNAGVFVGPRAAQLVQKGYFRGETLISPADSVDLTPWSRDETFNSGDVNDHVSYAMLAISANSSTRWERDAEWRDTSNAQAPVLSDRNTGSNATDRASSVWTNDPGDWKGHVAFNDGKVSFEQDQDIERTRYGSGDDNDDDNLFVAAAGTDDAAMTYSGDGTSASDFHSQGTP